MSGNRKTWNKFTRLELESLETRSLLSGIHAAAHAHVDVHHHSAIVSTSAVKATAVAAKSAGQQSETHLVATLADPAGVSKVTGTAKFTSETEHGVAKSELYVQVKGATPGTVIDVTLTGSTTPSGQITVKADGTGQLKLKANTPAVAADSVISLSTTDTAGASTLLASGTFAKSSIMVENSHDKDSDHSVAENETRLVASMADPASKLTGSARYESETEHGLVVSELSVQIKGATTGAVIDVSLASDATSPSVSIGKITIGADGTGRLKLNANVPAVTTSSIVTLSATAPDGTPIATIASAAFAAPPPTTKKNEH